VIHRRTSRLRGEKTPHDSEERRERNIGGDGFPVLPGICSGDEKILGAVQTGTRVSDQRKTEFERVYSLHLRDITAYVARRIPREEVDDVVAKVFVVAWRRFEDVPAQPEDRLWLFGVARRCVAHHRRSALRQGRLRMRLANEITIVQIPSQRADHRYDLVLKAMERLKPLDREALRLVLWDELSHADAAVVLGCSVNAFELRYRRARNSVRIAVEGESTVAPRPEHTSLANDSHLQEGQTP
jgi:RNA polymerase sigma factor (sigma-70 family)